MEDRKYGTIIKTGETWGMVLLQDGRGLPFQYKDFNSIEGPPSLRTLVKCSVVRHPYESGKYVCKNVIPVRIDELERCHGRILVASTNNFNDGKIRLASSSQLVTYRKSVVTQPVREGDSVMCVLPQHQAGISIALRVELQPAALPEAGTRTIEEIRTVYKGLNTSQTSLSIFAGATRKGTRLSKSVNEDAFLVTPLADGEFWLAAIADGVSSTQDSWWASTTCMELLWRSKQIFEKKLVETFERHGISIVDEWMNHIHQNFKITRARSAFQEATSTLTLAVGSRKAKKYVWGTCGDARIYEFGPTSAKPTPVISSEDLKLQRVSSGDDKYKLITHIGADQSGWSDHVVRERTLAANAKIFLCTDGVITQRTDPPLPFLKKFAVLNSLSKAQNSQELQDACERALADIAKLGEQDDLTLVAVRP